MYGSWESPITAEDIAGKAVQLVDVLVDQSTGRSFHLESRPAENGRVVVINDQGVELNPKEHNVRDGVHEYGGAAAIAVEGVVYYSNNADRRVYCVNADGGESKPVTPDNPAYRYANFSLYPNSTPHVLVSILEDHTEDTPSTVVTSLVLIHAESCAVTPLVSGADFYCSVNFSPDGKQIFWIEWYHPDMPWEGSLLKVANISPSFEVSDIRTIAGEKLKTSVLYPSWTPDSSSIVYICDESGYLTPYIHTLTSSSSISILPGPLMEDFSECFECFAGSPYVLLSNTHGIFSSYRGGRSILYLLSLSKPELHESESPYVSAGYLRSLGRDSITFLGSRVDASATIVKANNVLAHASFTEHPPPSIASAYEFPKEYASPPQPMTLDISGTPVHVLYFPPHNPKYSEDSEGDSLPPCIVSAHGGPTGSASQNLLPMRGYFTSRGWAWLDVNYSGSSRYGRAYRQRLQRNWGILDTRDVVNAARAISNAPHNLVDPKKMVIRGGSAGGYTVLAAMSTMENEEDLTVFAAGTSLYGISDMFTLATDTHKFESQYLFKLLGGKPDDPGMKEVYEKRSPVYNSDRIQSPLLLLQGSDDRVVPKEQSLAIKASIEERGGIVEYQEYEGEGHGWRKQDTMIDAIQREESAYKRWVLKL